jgi:hypothetical protein
MKYRVNGREKKLSIGAYPEVSLADGLRAWIACSRASSTKFAVALVLTFQPTMRRA